MATKKKELLEQENTAPETTVTVENAPPPDEAQADMAAPADGGDGSQCRRGDRIGSRGGDVPGAAALVFAHWGRNGQ